MTRVAFWAVVAMWALGAGIVTAALPAVTGLTDSLGNAPIRAISDAWRHMVGNVMVVILSLVSFWWRVSQEAAAAVLPWGLLLSSAVFLLLLYTGWKGSELAYGHRVGMQPEAPSQKHPS